MVSPLLGIPLVFSGDPGLLNSTQRRRKTKPRRQPWQAKGDGLWAGHRLK